MRAEEAVYVEQLEAIAREQASLIKRFSRILEKRAGDLENRSERLKAWKADPTVLVRWWPGPPVTIYHSSRRSCGRVQIKSHFEKVPLSEAKGRGLDSCSACGADHQLI